jgi:hypothetical protein
MLFTAISGGLNRQGALTTHDLNTRFMQTVPRGALADVRVYVLDDSVVTLFAAEGRRSDVSVSSFHQAAQAAIHATTTPSGLLPQPDPPHMLAVGQPAAVELDAAAVHAATTPSGLEPQADPPHVVGVSTPATVVSDSTVVWPQTTPTGADPQPDPPHTLRGWQMPEDDES